MTKPFSCLISLLQQLFLVSTNSFQGVKKASSFSLMNTGKVTEGPEHFSHEDKHEKAQ